MNFPEYDKMVRVDFSEWMITRIGLPVTRIESLTLSGPPGNSPRFLVCANNMIYAVTREGRASMFGPHDYDVQNAPWDAQYVVEATPTAKQLEELNDYISAMEKAWNDQIEKLCDKIARANTGIATCNDTLAYQSRQIARINNALDRISKTWKNMLDVSEE